MKPERRPAPGRLECSAVGMHSFQPASMTLDIINPGVTAVGGILGIGRIGNGLERQRVAVKFVGQLRQPVIRLHNHIWTRRRPHFL